MSDKWARSREQLARASKSLVGGVSSPFRAKFPVPLYFRDGRGSRLTDVDGNRYIDYALAWGPLILGHAHPEIARAVNERADKPHAYGAQHDLEPEVAERIQSLVPCAERVALTSSGSEAVQLALRLARAFTGRELILKFEGHYHGWMDSALLSYHPTPDEAGPPERPKTALASRGQVANAADNAAVARWNSTESLERALTEHAGRTAAVIMEPVLCNSGCLLPEPGYLESARRLCDAHGALLIFDEVITGFRLALGGAQEHYGVMPDLTTLGKALGGGLPLSAVVGRADVMDGMSAGVAFGGTFNGNPLSLAGGKATLDVLADAGETPLIHANRLGEALRDGLNAAFERRGVAGRAIGFGCAFAIHFTKRTELREYRDTWDDDAETLGRFLLEALREGVYILADGRFYVSTVHTESDVEETLAALERVLDRIAA